MYEALINQCYFSIIMWLSEHKIIVVAKHDQQLTLLLLICAMPNKPHTR